MSTEEDRKSMEEMITCSVCLELLTRPKLLGCLHSYCEACLQQMNKTFSSGILHIKCPDCNHLTALTPDGVLGLKPDFRSQQVRDILDVKCKKSKKSPDQSSSGKEGRNCDMCMTHVVTFCCFDCALCFCDNCKEQHDNNTSLVNHCVEKMAGKMLCKMHNQRLCTVYCRTCNSLCPVCEIGHDPSHEKFPIKIIRQHREELLSAMDQLSLEILNRRDELRSLGDNVKCKVREMILKVTEEAINEIKRKEAAYLQGLDVQMDDSLIESDAYLSEMVELRADIKNIMGGSPQTVFAAYDYLVSSIEKFKSSKPSVTLFSQGLDNAAKSHPAVENYRKMIFTTL